jgi:deoxyadenosine/deoxycytidine kinase
MSLVTKHSPSRAFIVEGNIGAGKSTFLKVIQKYLDATIIFEPLDKWQNVGGSSENLLHKFYTDTQRWSYTFQTYAFVSRVVAQEEHARRHAGGVHILERSVFSDRYCFAKNLFELGTMTALEWKLYQEWFAWLVEQYVVQPAGFIYMRTDPQVCYKRLQHRGRHEEAIVPFEYLMQLHTKHEQWLMEREGVAESLKEVPVLVVPCDQDFEHDTAEQERHMTAIAQFINDHGGRVSLQQGVRGAQQIIV